ncbi:hypothetical protein LEP1GSC133_1066 [Leptospira borgpetersenii serovar Pomona str. 200901868]|uniref:Uncharacterized protein n=1 Tax=Leptospira borgpetersenii serovar Pomona str. 200901868 TaxID=1192866 RepID=M6W4B8_LEPBO|nr:hypothetical protein LEP1GSC133_1066 [Leptospira borgpetersenii serovar Pomona str. 200901868]
MILYRSVFHFRIELLKIDSSSVSIFRKWLIEAVCETSLWNFSTTLI